MLYGSGTVAHTASQYDVTRAWRASGQPEDADACIPAIGGQTSLPPSWKYDVISKNPTPLIDAYLLEERSRQISSRSDLKR